MHSLRMFPSLLGLLFGASFSVAQSSVLDLPRPSQHAVVTQRIGVTDITINYHRPLVNGRKIWGGVVPYGQVWRAGANENTTISFSDPVTIEGKPLEKGTYGLHMLPADDHWTAIFSKVSTAWGSFSYDQAEDALRVTVKPQPTDLREALTYDFDDLTANSALVTLRWEKLAVPFKVAVDLNHVVEQSLHQQLRGLAQYTWDGWDDAANYMLASKMDLGEALKYEDRSMQVEERFDNLLTKSRILDALGRKGEAKTTLAQALEKGTALQLYSYGRQLQGEKRQDEAFAIYRSDAKRYPNEWIVHAGMARVYSGQGDFDSAVKEMRLSLASAPNQQKAGLEGLVKRLEAKDDINK